MDKQEDKILLNKIHEELVLIRTEIDKLLINQTYNNLVKEKESFIIENQTTLSVSVQVGSIIMAAIIFLLTIPIPGLPRLFYEFIMISLSISEMAFIISTTYYMRGSNPEHDKHFIKYLNRKGDLFLAFGWTTLFFAPIILLAMQRLIFAVLFSLVFFSFAMRSIFSDGIGTYAYKLIIYSIYYRNFERASERARREGRTRMDDYIIWTWYIIAAIAGYIIYLEILKLIFPK